ncbi:MAG: helix-turn-helix transcriptional regulator [Planctomycetes bacterium]|jgi:ArsR family transcriptional regulator|nr:helix-turn-helix transcriptional regulator [Planctomycetota bacterium]MBT4029582.1 helix-turn-helix transcriptional regulator [Planctomycetota bacterium]MBT4560548.1 helix-turn-helix transcriptional regulator [Planctomycetota bacterium]MBT5101579.1 helix-turn-helix transcriptional regulator [Planctomycetota bacterium]MBT5119382.1 helix-turn-helix transcriptional regulator [Planctomycetota bacterium]
MNDKLPLVPLEMLAVAAPLIRVAAHPVRLRIIDYLLHNGEACVGDIAKMAETEQAVTSQHLATLRQHQVLAARREGQRVIYSLIVPELEFLLDCISSHCRIDR